MTNDLPLKERLTLLGGRRFLVPSSLESTFRRTREQALSKAAGWSDEARLRGILIDLSRVEWVELSAVVQLVLITEHARTNGVDVAVALPLERFRASEERHLHDDSDLVPAAKAEIRQHVVHRRKAASFLRRLSFAQALDAEHLVGAPGRLSILKDYDADGATPSTVERSTQPGVRPDDPGPTPDLDPLREVVLKLEWIDRADDEGLDQVASRLMAVLGSPTRGIAGLDVETIADVVLSELVANAIEYSGSPRALVAAFARPPSEDPAGKRGSIPYRSKDYLRGEQSFMDWVDGHESPGVQVIVGDSGMGLATHLGPGYDRAQEAGTAVPTSGVSRDANILAWAFDRFSTSDPQLDRPGTRGLYRVDRVVKRHSGLVTIRSNDQLVGWDHGGPAYDKRIDAGEPLGAFPGTLIRVHLARKTASFPPRPQEEHARAELEVHFDSLGLDDEGNVRIGGDPLHRAASRLRGDQLAVVTLPRDLTRRQPAAALRQIAAYRDPAAIAVVGLADAGGQPLM